VTAQLRGMLSAEQSAEVAQENQDHRTIGPEITQAVAAAVGRSELHLFQPFQIHCTGTLLPRQTTVT
jgi:hypothetical protein